MNTFICKVLDAYVMNEVALRAANLIQIRAVLGEIQILVLVKNCCSGSGSKEVVIKKFIIQQKKDLPFSCMSCF